MYVQIDSKNIKFNSKKTIMKVKSGIIFFIKKENVRVEQTDVVMSNYLNFPNLFR